MQGTAWVTIADLLRPRPGAAIALSGHEIGAIGCADMALTSRSMASGKVGIDHPGGNCHRPQHEEAWFAFHSADYVGAFGTKREP